MWFVSRSSSNYTYYSYQQWGLAGDIPVPCDYDGDAKTDLAVFRPSNSTWYVVNSSNGALWSNAWGIFGDIPTVGDFNNDGKCELTVWRPSNGFWYILNPATNTFTAPQHGLTGDRPMPMDRDGDGKADLVVWRPSNGTWYGINSSNGAYWQYALGSGGGGSGGSTSDVALPNYPGAKNLLANVFVAQEQTNWCWNATTQMIKAYYNIPMTQCANANIRTGRSDCCNSTATAAAFCNWTAWWTPLDTAHFTYSETTGTTALTFAALQAEFAANRPVGYGWQWIPNSNGQHIMVAIGAWVTTAGVQWVTVNDPAQGQIDMTYTNYVSASDHSHMTDGYNIRRTN